MIILSIRSDNPQAEIGLFDDSKKLAYETWQAHRELSSTIHTKIEKLLADQNKAWQDIEGIICYKGPGSFTGLRIGITVANTVAAELKIPIASSTGDDWADCAIADLGRGANEKLALPEYGGEIHITQQKK